MSEKKKILFVANVAKEHINKFHIPTIEFFKAQGWQVDVACSGDDEVPGCDHRFYGKWKRSPFQAGTFFGVIQLIKILKKTSYDVVYCHTPVGGLVARLAVMFLKNKPKIVYFAHGFHFYKGCPRKYWFTIYPIERILANNTDLLITLNYEDYELAKKKIAKKAKIVFSPGVGVNFSKLVVNDKTNMRSLYRNKFKLNNEILLIYIAELIENKNQGMLIEVLKKLTEKRNDIVLVLVGPDHANGYYQNMAKRLGLSEKIIFTGWRNDIGELLNMSDIYVASSVREGFGINLIEAMFLGLPVVAVNNRGHKTIIKDGENGFLVNLNDIDTMAARILEIIENPSIKEQFSQFNVDKYDAKRIAKNIYCEINKIL